MDKERPGGFVLRLEGYGSEENAMFSTERGTCASDVSVPICN